jgi:hypothetical protein
MLAGYNSRLQLTSSCFTVPRVVKPFTIHHYVFTWPDHLDGA